MKSIFILVFFVGFFCNAFGQNSSQNKLYQFDDKKYNELFNPDSTITLLDTLIIGKDEKNDIKAFQVPEKSMAKMPNKSIKKDIHYTMQIKRYSLSYPYTPEIAPDTTKRKNPLFMPLYIPKE